MSEDGGEGEGRRGSGWGRVVVLVGLLAVVIFGVRLCIHGEDEKRVPLVVEIDGKSWVWVGDESSALDAIADGQAPQMPKVSGFFVTRGHYYVDPSDMEDIVDVLAGNFGRIDAEQGPQAGYLVETGTSLVSTDLRTEATAKVGETRRVRTATIRHPRTEATFEIVWSEQPRPEAIENCLVAKIWAGAGGHQGTGRSFVRRRQVLVSVDELVDFLGDDVSVHYDGDVVRFVPGG